MSTFTINEILSILETQRSFIDSIKPLSDEQINWSPSKSEVSKRNTIGILLEHLTGAEKFLVHQVIFGMNVNRNRDAEFSHDKVRNKTDLVLNYEETAKKTTELLKSINDDTLKEMRSARGNERSVLWALLHVMEHNYYHIGQINYILAVMKN